MSKTEDFLTAEQESEIVEAIRLAEENTSGEIRVHIEEKSEKPPFERAKEVFNNLEMFKTEARNAVLFYVDVADKKLAIIGDEGIDKVVSADFWNSTKDIVIQHFKNKDYTTGFVEGITEAGNQLKKHFPYQSNDVNELTNEISKG
jgi:uncharacterized membrane protein